MRRTILRTAFISGALAGSVLAFGVAQASGEGKGNPEADSFVCPVLGGQAGEHGNSGAIHQLPSGEGTVIGPNLKVPMHATNDDGAGSPGDHVSPGDPNYSPIWYGITN